MSPRRIQRKRTKGWRMPEGAVYVGRPSKWGNPHALTATELSAMSRVPTRAEVVARYEQSIRDNDAGARFHQECPTSAYIREHLAGRDLACWCPLDQPCHADVLLRVANSPDT